jgi:hypothetical protein
MAVAIFSKLVDCQRGARRAIDPMSVERFLSALRTIYGVVSRGPCPNQGSFIQKERRVKKCRGATISYHLIRCDDPRIVCLVREALAANNIQLRDSFVPPSRLVDAGQWPMPFACDFTGSAFDGILEWHRVRWPTRDGSPVGQEFGQGRTQPWDDARATVWAAGQEIGQGRVPQWDDGGATDWNEGPDWIVW